MLLWKTLFILLIAKTVFNNQCQPKFLLQNALHDNVNLNVFVPQQSAIIAEYSYKFSRNLFTNQPVALLSIAGFDLQNYAQINYVLSSLVQNDSLLINLKSVNMAWKVVNVLLILHSRTDIFSQLNAINVTANLETQVQCVKQLASPAESFLFVHFILGIKAYYSQSYQFSVDDVQLTGSKGTFALKANTNSTFYIQTVYFEATEKQFSYTFDQIIWQPKKDSQYHYIWAQFAPVVYSLVGMNKFSFSGMSLQISLNLDLTNNLLSLKSGTQFQKIETLFFAVGQLPTEVCSPCNNYISISGCLDQCPTGSFPTLIEGGGKTCRQCLKQLGQTTNTNGVECTCLNGLIFFEGNCYKSELLPLKCSNEQLLLNGKCMFKNVSQVISCLPHSHPNSNLTSCDCDEGYDKFNENCLQKCPKYSSRTTFGICACNYGYIMNSSHLCESICPKNSIYHAELGQCKCNYGYQMISNECSQCPQGQVYDPSTSKCLVAFYSVSQQKSELSLCKANEIVVNGKCQCDQWSIDIGGRCAQCPFKTFKQANRCQDCPNYCLNCSSLSFCKQCEKGFDLINGNCVQICGDGRKFAQACDDGNKVDGDGCSSVCTVESGYVCQGGSPISTDICQKIDNSVKSLSIRLEAGYPIYTSKGIITNLIVNPPIQRTEQQLHKLFTFEFSQFAARPNAVILSQSDSDPTSIRCFFSYQNNLPNLAFTVTFNLNENPYGSAKLSQIYDTLNNAITSAINLNNRLPNRDRLT